MKTIWLLVAKRDALNRYTPDQVFETQADAEAFRSQLMYPQDWAVISMRVRQ